jgi:hypothetical protein
MNKRQVAYMEIVYFIALIEFLNTSYFYVVKSWAFSVFLVPIPFAYLFVSRIIQSDKFKIYENYLKMAFPFLWAEMTNILSGEQSAIFRNLLGSSMCCDRIC